jgi:hypothetical protein
MRAQHQRQASAHAIRALARVTGHGYIKPPPYAMEEEEEGKKKLEEEEEEE